jgi:hypothetical protein
MQKDLAAPDRKEKVKRGFTNAPDPVGLIKIESCMPFRDDVFFQGTIHGCF